MKHAVGWCSMRWGSAACGGVVQHAVERFQKEKNGDEREVASANCNSKRQLPKRQLLYSPLKMFWFVSSLNETKKTEGAQLPFTSDNIFGTFCK
jgi:hypothetical protein